mgnify:CR=1 FL=1
MSYSIRLSTLCTVACVAALPLTAIAQTPQPREVPARMLPTPTTVSPQLQKIIVMETKGLRSLAPELRALITTFDEVERLGAGEVATDEGLDQHAFLARDVVRDADLLSEVGLQRYRGDLVDEYRAHVTAPRPGCGTCRATP